MKSATMTVVLMLSCAALAQESVSPFAPAQIIPASENSPMVESAPIADRPAADTVGRDAPIAPQSATTDTVGRDAPIAPPPRRARPPHERRREGAIPGLVVMPYGKTASGERTHIYRVMGQGGVVADFTDYGARLVRLYAPDETGDLTNIIDGFKPSVLDCEKSGDLAEVWKMTPIRRPRATGLVFESVGRDAPIAPQATQSNNLTIKQSNNSSPRITYWLDASNTLSIESTIADTNAVKWSSSLRLAPFVNRPLTIKTPDASLSLSATTNITDISLRPLTNTLQHTEFNFKGIKKL